MGWNYLCILKVQWCTRWSLETDKWFNLTLYQACGYLSMLWLKLNHVSRRDTCRSNHTLCAFRHSVCVDRVGTWWRHQMEIFSALLAICAENSPIPGEFPAQRPVTRSFDVFFDLRLNKRLSKQSGDWWFETPVWSLWRHRNEKCQLSGIFSLI